MHGLSSRFLGNVSCPLSIHIVEASIDIFLHQVDDVFYFPALLLQKGRCFHCERVGTKIVHPSLGSYHGQSGDFKLMARGKHSLTNKALVGAGEPMTVFAHAMVTQDFVYSDTVDTRAFVRQEFFGPKNGASVSSPEVVM